MERLLIEAGTIIKGQDLTGIKNGAVLMEDGKISEIHEQVTGVEGLGDAATMDIGDKTSIPDMVDCCNHPVPDARISNCLVKMNDREAEQALRVTKTMHDDLHAGVTTARCLGDKYHIDATCRQAQREGRLEGPRLVVSGVGMKSFHGHGYIGMPHCSVEDFRKIPRENITRGVDSLRVFMIEAINATPFIYHFTIPEEFRTVAKGVKSVNITTACHCPGGQGLDDCPTAGTGCPEHMYYIIKGQVKRVKRMNRWVVYTPSYALNSDLLFRFSPRDEGGNLGKREIVCSCPSEAITGGLKFGIGIDGLHGSLAREAQYITQLEANNRNMLIGATTQVVKLYGVNQITNATKKGLIVDLVIADDNPLEDMKVFSRVEHVIRGGNIAR